MFNGKIKDLTFNRFGKSILTIETNTDLRGLVDRLNEKDLDIEIKEHKEKRAKEGNARARLGHRNIQTSISR